MQRWLNETSSTRFFLVDRYYFIITFWIFNNSLLFWIGHYYVKKVKRTKSIFQIDSHYFFITTTTTTTTSVTRKKSPNVYKNCPMSIKIAQK